MKYFVRCIFLINFYLFITNINGQSTNLKNSKIIFKVSINTTYSGLLVNLDEDYSDISTAFISANNTYYHSFLQFSPNLEWGYKSKNNFYIGLEVNYHYPTKALHTNKYSFITTYYLKNTIHCYPRYSLLFKCGCFVKDSFLIYGKIGLMLTKFKHTTLIDNDSPSSDLTSLTFDAIKNIQAPLFGIGIEKYLNDYIAIGLEYTVAVFNEIKGSKITNITIPTVVGHEVRDNRKITKKIRLQQNNLSLRLSYRF